MTNQTEQGAALAENPSPELLRVHQAGTTLANIAYNLAQRPGEPLTSDVVASLDACRREWDAACAAFKAARVALAKSTPEGYTSDGNIREAVALLERIACGSCSCLTKTPDPAHHKEGCGFKMLCQAIDLLSPSAPASSVGTSITIDYKQATEILEMFAGEPCEITLNIGDGHSGKGLYAWWTDMPDEGAMYFGVSDEAATPGDSHAT